MSSRAAWILGLAVVLLLVLAGYAYLSNPNEVAPIETPTEFPTENPLTSGGGATITTATGQQVETANFLMHEDTVEDPANPGIYLLAGSLPYCEPSVDCEATPVTSYTIRYDDASDSFTIGLAEEPIGEVRREAETYLMSRLGLTERQMCALNYYVGTSYWVNETYASGNLGFSFCPNATPLPE